MDKVMKRVLQAIKLIEDQNMGVDSAAKSVGTDRRTVYRYLKDQGKRIVRSGAGKAFKIKIEDMPQQAPDVVSRVKKALALMERRGIGVDRASKMVGTDRRTVYRYLQRQGIKSPVKVRLEKLLFGGCLFRKKLISFGLCPRENRHLPLQKN